jgi:hypothetical protein
MNEFWELMLTVLGIYLLGVMTGVIGSAIAIFIYLRPGGSIIVKEQL